MCFYSPDTQSKTPEHSRPAFRHKPMTLSGALPVFSASASARALHFSSDGKALLRVGYADCLRSTLSDFRGQCFELTQESEYLKDIQQPSKPLRTVSSQVMGRHICKHLIHLRCRQVLLPPFAVRKFLRVVVEDSRGREIVLTAFNSLTLDMLLLRAFA